jgi:hypothetical protein
MSVVRDAVAVAVQAGRESKRIILKPGTISSVSVDQTIAEILVDDDPNTGEGGGDDVAVDGVLGAQMLYPAVREGDRVMVMFMPPHGVFVIGRLSGDFEDWHFVGDPDEVAFAANWGNALDTGLPGTDNFSRVKYRRIGRFVEVRGRATRTTDTGGPSTIFTLPDQYTPKNKYSVPAPNGLLGATNALILITLAGAVQVLKFAGTVGGGTINDFVSLDGICFSAEPD